MAGESRFGVVHVPDFSPGMSSFLRIGTAAEDDYHWRDHTDGNRISTTGGDKIEVIGGNYQLKVLGRQEHQSGVNVDGSKLGQDSITFRGIVKREGGKILEETVKGDMVTIYHGDNFDEYYGSRLESQTGSASPGTDRENPDVLERTWAKRIESYTGSAALRIPELKQETWAEKMVSKTDAFSVTSDTLIAEGSSSKMKARTITSETTADSTKDTTTVTGNIESETRASKLISTTHADSDSKTYGNAVSYTEGNSTATILGIENTVNIGMVNEVVVGMMNDVTVGMSASATVGAEFSLTVGVDASLTVGAEIEVDLGELKLEPSHIKLHLDRTKTSAFRKCLAAFNLLA